MCHKDYHTTFLNRIGSRGGGRFFVAGLLFLICCLFFCKTDSQAMTKHTIQRRIEGLGAYYPGNDFGRQLDLSCKSYVRHEWHGVAGVAKTCTYESPTVSNTKDAILFLVPTVQSGFEYRDALDIYFEDVGSYRGRDLNARMHFDSIKFGPYTPNGKYNVSYSSNPAGVFLLRPYTGPEIFFGRSDQQEWFPGFEQRYDAVKDFQVTVTVTYADTSEVADIPFYQYVDDIDDNNVWNTYGAREGVTFGNGFTDDLYVYDGFRCEVNNRTIKVPNDGRNHNYSDFYMPPPAPGATSGERQSDDKRVAEAGWFLNACWGATANGQFTVTFHGSNAVTQMNIRSPYLKVQCFDEPRKTGSLAAGDKSKLSWTIWQRLPRLEDEVLAPLESLAIEDTIQSGQTYESCQVLDEYNNDISDLANISYANGTVKVELKPSMLADRAWSGKTVKVKITCHFNDGVSEASNTAKSTINRRPSCPTNTPYVSQPSYDGLGMELYKDVLNPKETYGPGDEVEFLCLIDLASCYGIDRDIDIALDTAEDMGYKPSYIENCFRHGQSWAGGSIMSLLNDYLTDFHYTDTIPEGLELVGEPLVTNCRFCNSWSRISNPAGFSRYIYLYDTGTVNWDRFLRVHGRPITQKEAEDFYYGCGFLSTIDIPEHDVTKSNKDDTVLFHQPAIYIKGCDRDDGYKIDRTEFLKRIGDGKAPMVPISQYFSKSFNEWSKNRGLDIHPKASEFFSNYGFRVNYDSRSISVRSVGSTVLDGFNAWETFYADDYVGDDPFLFTQDDWKKVQTAEGAYCGYLGIYYKCRVTGSVTNGSVTNVSDFSCKNVGVLHDDVPKSSSSSVFHDNWKSEFWNYYKIVDVSPELKAKADATVHIGGYQVTTEVVNGKIDDDVYDIEGGSNVDIGYRPRGGYYLDRIEVDGTSIPLGGNQDLYRFKNIQRSHHIKVVYEPGFQITTEVVNGSIDPDVTARPSETRTIHYSPNEGYMLSTVEVDGNLVDMSTCLDAYTFTNIQADHHIKVTYIPKYKIETSIEHGTITPTIRNITPGASHTISYTPDDGYYVKSVTVDGRPLPVSELKQHLTNYTFNNVNEDHTIHVVCVPYPTITITKEIEDLSQIIWAKGSPVFMFMISGTDYLGNIRSYTREIAFGSSDGNTKSVTLWIPAGQWMVSELRTNGWQQVSVKAGNACTISGSNGVLDTRNAGAAGVTFVNRVSDWNKYTENDDRVNRLK